MTGTSSMRAQSRSAGPPPVGWSMEESRATVAGNASHAACLVASACRLASVRSRACLEATAAVAKA